MFRSSIRLLGDRQADRLPAALLLSFRSAAIRGISRSTRAFLFLAEAAVECDELRVGGEGTQRVAWALSGEWQCDRDGENGKQDEAHGSLPGVISVRDAAAGQSCTTYARGRNRTRGRPRGILRAMRIPISPPGPAKRSARRGPPPFFPLPAGREDREGSTLGHEGANLVAVVTFGAGSLAVRGVRVLGSHTIGSRRVA